MKGAISLALMAVASMGASAAFVDQCSALTSINVGSGCSAGTVATGSPLEVDIPITLEQATKPIYIAVWNTGASTTFDADITVSMTGPDATTYTEGANFVRKQVGALDWGYTLELAANAACAGTFKLTIANGQSSAVGVGVFVRVGDRGLTQTFRPRQETFSRTPMMTKFEVTPFDSWTANVEDSVISTPQIMKQISFMIANGASFNDQGTFTLQQVGNSALAAVTTATNTSGTTAMANYTDISRHNGAIKLAYTAAGTPPAYSIDEIGPYVTVMVSTSEFMQYPLMTGLMDITVPVGGTSDVYRVALTSTWHKLMPQYGNAATNLSTFAAMNPVTKAAVGMAGNKVNDVDGMVNNAVTGLLTTFLASPQTNNLNQLQRLAPVPANAANAFAFVAFGAGCSATAGQAITGSAQLKVMNVPGECQSYRDCDKSGSDHPSLSYRLSANDDEERLRHCVVAPSPENPLMPYTRCMECLADCDCESGQYCHKDAGVCNTVNGVYTCDLGSAQKLGLCRKKDINKEILGKACRSGAGATLAQSGAFAVAANPNTAQLLVSEGPNYNGDDTSATADKFCGEVLFYNASSNVANVRGGEARSILWEGYCFNGECHECAPNTVDTCQGRRSCINGQQMETINVDGTIRTFTSNTVAGTLLAGVMMIILVQALIVCRICQARKYHRAGEAKEAVEDDAESIKA